MRPMLLHIYSLKNNRHYNTIFFVLTLEKFVSFYFMFLSLFHHFGVVFSINRNGWSNYFWRWTWRSLTLCSWFLTWLCSLLLCICCWFFCCLRLVLTKYLHENLNTFIVLSLFLLFLLFSLCISIFFFLGCGFICWIIVHGFTGWALILILILGVICCGVDLWVLGRVLIFHDLVFSLYRAWILFLLSVLAALLLILLILVFLVPWHV